MASSAPSSATPTSPPTSDADVKPHRHWKAGALMAATTVAMGAFIVSALGGHFYDAPMQRAQQDTTCVKEAQTVDEEFRHVPTISTGGLIQIETRSLFIVKASYMCGTASHRYSKTVEQSGDLRGVTYADGTLLNTEHHSDNPPPIELFNWRSTRLNIPSISASPALVPKI